MMEIIQGLNCQRQVRLDLSRILKVAIPVFYGNSQEILYYLFPFPNFLESAPSKPKWREEGKTSWSEDVLSVLRSLRKEQYSRVEIGHLFKSLGLPNFTYCLSVYGASEPDLKIIQHFSDRCHKRRFVSIPVPIKDLLYRQDCKILKAIASVDNNPLGSILSPKKENKYNLRKEQCALPKSNTERFMTSYVNRLIFKHKMM